MHAGYIRWLRLRHPPKSNTLLDGFTGLGHFLPGDHTTTSLTMWLASHWTFLYSSGLLSVSGR